MYYLFRWDIKEAQCLSWTSYITLKEETLTGIIFALRMFFHRVFTPDRTVWPFTALIKLKVQLYAKKTVPSGLRRKSPERRDVRGLPKLFFRESFSLDDSSRISMIALLNLTTRALTCSDDRTSSRRRDSYYSSVCFIFFAIFGSQPVAAARERDVIPLENLALGGGARWRQIFALRK